MNVVKRQEEIKYVKGYTRAIALDFNRSNFEFIPNEMIRFLSEIEGNVYKKICFSNTDYSSEVANDYYLFLIENEFIFDINTELYQNFPPLSLDWDFPGLITNVIIDIPIKNDHIQHIINLIELLGCKHIFLNFLSNTNIDTEVLSLFDNTIIQSIDVKCESKQLTSVFKNYPSINNIYIVSEEDKIENTETGFGNIIYYKKQFNNNDFSIDIKLFSESQKHHTYFNRKLYIGSKGEIKNAPECEEEFGYIQDIKDIEELKQIIATPEFQNYWFVHKELCDVCKDCEFKHMCVDNRLPYQRKDSSWYHKIECNYNPYICKWKDEEGYKTLEECGVVSNEKGFSINHEKVTAINKTLWEEVTENA